MSVDERGDNNLVVESDRVTIDVLRLNFDVQFATHALQSALVEKHSAHFL